MTTTLERPAESAGALYRRTDISPEDFFQTLGRVRRDVRDEIERLIEWLDSTIDTDEDRAVDDDPCDGDPDAEPSLGSFDRMSDQIKAWQARPVTADIDTELDNADDEPILGSVAAGEHGNQEDWALGVGDGREGDGCADDREGDEEKHGGEGVKEDDEPSLGWTEEESARGRVCAETMGSSADLEEGPGARRPQNRTVIDRKPITAVNTYRRFLRGLPDGQQAAVRKRMQPEAKVTLT
jgi:hypothetical protein